MARLLVQLQPKLMESPRGYGLRLSEANQYRTASDLLYAAGFTASDIGSSTYPMEKLTSILNIDELTLGRMNYSRESKSKKHTFMIYGTEFDRAKRESPWLIQEGQICPHCINEDGHADITNDLKYMVGCHRHGIQRLRICSSCNEPLNWNRSYLMRCGNCGFHFDKGKLKPLSREHRVLMQVLHHKAHQIKLSKIQDTAGFPIDWLEKTSLGDLIWILKRVVEALDSSATNVKDDFEITYKMAHLLSAWPMNFRSMIDQALIASDSYNLEEPISEKVIFQRAKLSGLSLLLSKQSGVCGEFFRKELLTHASNNGHYLASKLLKGVYPFNQKYVSQTMLAELLNIDLGTVKDWVGLGLIRIKKIPTNQGARVAIDIGSPGLQPLLPGRLFGKREAGPRVGIPPVILEQLRKMGVYEVKSMPIFMKLFHEKDLDIFASRLIKLSKRIETNPESKTISLSHGLIHYKFGQRDGKSKAEFVSKYLKKEIKSLGRLSNHPADILFKNELFGEYARNEREKVLIKS